MLTFFVDSAIGLFTLEPIILSYVEDGIELDIVCDQTSFETVNDRLGKVSGLNIKLWKPTAYITRMNALHLILQTLITPYTFPKPYKSLTAYRFAHRGFLLGFIYKLSLISPKLSYSRINRFLVKIFGVFPNLKFGSKKVIVASRIKMPFILCQPKLEVTTVMESWDHPAKTPVGYVSNQVFCWNNALVNDWKKYQGDQTVLKYYPTKLGFWVENSIKEKQALGDSHKKFMYPATCSSHSIRDQMFQREMEFLEVLCDVFEQTGHILYIKPKPNGVEGDFDSLANKYKCVEIGRYNNTVRPETFFLTDELNRSRKKELDQCDCVINFGTTFALDAALYGKPVLQLNFLMASGFEKMADIQKNYHLLNYFLSKTELTFNIQNKKSFQGEVLELIRSQKWQSKAEGFTAYLKEWIYPDLPISEAIAELKQKVT